MVGNSPCSSRLSTVEPGVRVYTGFYGNHEVSGGEKNRQSCVLMKIDTRKVYIHTFFLPILGKKKNPRFLRSSTDGHRVKTSFKWTNPRTRSLQPGMPFWKT